MTIYKSKRDGKLYVLSINRTARFTGSWLECMPYHDFRMGRGHWDTVPLHRKKDFIPVGTC